MNTGKVEFAPDYRSDFEAFSCPKCGGSKPTCCSCPDSDPLTFAVEQARLRCEVIEAAKKWQAQAVAHGFDLYAEEQAIADAVVALNTFESKQETK